jgi:hypothetical protein
MSWCNVRFQNARGCVHAGGLRTANKVLSECDSRPEVEEVMKHQRVRRSSRATAMPRARAASRNHFAIGRPTRPKTTNAAATRMPANSASTRIRRKGPGWRWASRSFIGRLSHLRERGSLEIVGSNVATVCSLVKTVTGYLGVVPTKFLYQLPPKLPFYYARTARPS